MSVERTGARADGIAAGEVTIADLYREIVGMRADVARALERLALVDQRNQSADRLHADHEERLRALEQPPNSPEITDHEGRIRSLEERWWKVAGALIVVNFVLVSLAYYLIHHH